MEIIIILTLLFIAAQTTYLSWNHFQRNRHSRKQHMPIFVDTSVLIDGRILAVAESGFITSTLFIPRSVVGELQFLADNGDTDKRTRARHGLDVIKQLQAIERADVQVFNDGTSAEEGVDNRLLSLAKQYKGAVCTIDFNLNKVAQVEKVPVLNVNDLAKTLRMAYLPGEKLQLELTQKGHDSHQAIGHLADGTMVVVEHASAHVGKTIEVEFIRSLQTAAGKMMFAKLAHQTKQPQAPKPKTKGRQPTEKNVTQVPQASQPPQVPQAPTKKPIRKPVKQQNKPKRPRSPEDRLVDLANQ